MLHLCLPVCQDTLRGSEDGSRFCKGFVLRVLRVVTGFAQGPLLGETVVFIASGGACRGRLGYCKELFSRFRRVATIAMLTMRSIPYCNV